MTEYPKNQTFQISGLSIDDKIGIQSQAAREGKSGSEYLLGLHKEHARSQD